MAVAVTTASTPEQMNAGLVEKALRIVADDNEDCHAKICTPGRRKHCACQRIATAILALGAEDALRKMAEWATHQSERAALYVGQSDAFSEAASHARAMMEGRKG